MGKNSDRQKYCKRYKLVSIHELYPKSQFQSGGETNMNYSININVQSSEGSIEKPDHIDQQEVCGIAKSEEQEFINKMINANDNVEKCAPTKNYSAGSCIPLDSLINMAKAYNAKYPNNPINIQKNFNNQDEYKKYLVGEFEKKLTKCDSQKCWVDTVKKGLSKNELDDLENNTFRPEGPYKGNTWLNTNNINDVMNQYTVKYTDFVFLGAVPIDFDNLTYETQIPKSNNDFKKMVSKNKTKLGIIFNTHPHTGPGEHWIAMYADLAKGTCYYFDSYGIPPPKQIKAFMDRVTEYIKSTGKNCTCESVKKRHQYGGSECGVYSMAFILRMLRGENFETFNRVRTSDTAVRTCRGIYFNPETK